MISVQESIAALTRFGWLIVQADDDHYFATRPHAIDPTGSMISAGMLQRLATHYTADNDDHFPSFEIALDLSGKGHIIMDGMHLLTMSVEVIARAGDITKVRVEFPAEDVRFTLPKAALLSSVLEAIGFWICGACGHKNFALAQFCSACGAAKAEEVRPE